MEKLIEPDNLQYISPVYQCEKSINAYYAMKYLHCQGQAYKSFIENMYYLNDDYNDELYHFSAAIERYKINFGIIDNNIEKLKKRTKNSDMYKHEKYIEEVLFSKKNNN